jgi:hypothetical protein
MQIRGSVCPFSSTRDRKHHNSHMPTPKLSISPWKVSVCGTVCAGDVDGQEAACMEPLFDFRSNGFAADAVTLARTTGCALERCRQELFIAEGDMGLAYHWLVAGYDLQPDDSVLH